MPDLPQRIQRQRTPGWRMPEGAVYVGRPSRWGNPWRAEQVQGVGWCCTDPGGRIVQARDRHDAHDLATAHFRAWLPRQALDLAPLRGRPLACWCPLDVPCHANVLLEVANG